MNEKTAEEIRKEIREAFDSACRAFARYERAIQRIVSEIDWEACEEEGAECGEESDEKESLKTLSDFVREAGEHLGWPPETIESELSKVAAYGTYGTYYTRDKAAFEYVFAQVNLATITGETESNWEAHTRQPHVDEGIDGLSLPQFTALGEPEYIIREFRRD